MSEELLYSEISKEYFCSFFVTRISQMFLTYAFIFLIFFDTFLNTMYARILNFPSSRFWLCVATKCAAARLFFWRCRFTFMLRNINTFYLPSLFMTRYMRKMFPHSLQKLEIFDFLKSLQLFHTKKMTSVLKYIVLKSN